MAKVAVRVMKNGIVVHKHEGADGFHGASRNHGTFRGGEPSGLHKTIGMRAMTSADGIGDLTDAQKRQYAEALAGKTFWIYPKKAVRTVTEPATATAEAVEVSA